MERGGSAVDREDRHALVTRMGAGATDHRHRPLCLNPPSRTMPIGGCGAGPFLAPTHRGWRSSGRAYRKITRPDLPLPQFQRVNEVVGLLVATEMKLAEALRSRRAAGADERLAVDPEGVA